MQRRCLVAMTMIDNDPSVFDRDSLQKKQQCTPAQFRSSHKLEKHIIEKKRSA